MKTKIFITALCLLASLLLNAQLKVSSVGNVGNVGIQVGTSTPLSSLAIGDVGFSEWRAYITGPKIALKVQKIGGSPSAGATFCGIDASTDLISAGPTFNYAVKGVSSSTATVANARSFGVFGSAGYGESGYNYGVYGNFNYTAPGNGAGILGILSTSNVSDVYVPGIYAGYFVGAVKCTSSMTATGYFTSSDKRFKKNIVSLDVTKSINGILALNPVEYNLEQRYIKAHRDTNEIQLPMYDEKSQLFQKKHYGLIAQELQKTYPDLVYEDTDGYLSVNYTGLIPVLIQSIKELNAEIEILKPKTGNGPSKVGASPTTGIVETDALTYPVLEQNTPNPFNTETTIGFYLPTTINVASIYIYDMNGGQLKNIIINERNKGNITIKGSEFSAGMYLYALIADGKVIDTKRMILTK
ncbi:MAG: tail fiber domain-containing protein [Paludibacter sp.]